jgi:hypothetical protein
VPSLLAERARKTVLVPRAGGPTSCPSLFFHRDRDQLQGIVEFVAHGGDDLVHHLHATKDLAEDGLGCDSCCGGCVEDILHGLSEH